MWEACGSWTSGGSFAAPFRSAGARRCSHFFHAECADEVLQDTRAEFDRIVLCTGFRPIFAHYQRFVDTAVLRAMRRGFRVLHAIPHPHSPMVIDPLRTPSVARTRTRVISSQAAIPHRNIRKIREIP